MNINQRLLKETGPFLTDYECETFEIESLLCGNKRFVARQQNSVDLVNSIMSPHGKRHLFEYVYQLGQVEYTIRPLLIRQRDHVVHALLSFILGIYLNEKLVNFKLGSRVNCFQWELAGLLHDIGYPLEIANQAIMTPFFVNAQEIRNALGVRSLLGLRLVPVGLNHLTNHRTSLEIIQQQISRWDLAINARTEYRRSVNSGNINHGIVGSLILLNMIDAMYQKYNRTRESARVIDNGVDWNQDFFERDIVPACSAIFLHNLPVSCFSESKIEISRAPLAFLLKMSDSLQEWWRPSQENPRGYPSSNFDITMDQGKLIIKAKIPEEVKIKMRNEIALCLAAPNVEII
jgi:hypothetical protein